MASIPAISTSPAGAMKRISAQTWLLLAVLAAASGLAAYVAVSSRSAGGPGVLTGAAVAGENPLRLDDIPFNGARAYEYLEQICELGPRPSGSTGMRRQRQMLVKHFKDLGGEVTVQDFQIRHPLTGRRVPMANLIVEWHPEKTERVLLAAHFDTRPFPDQDPLRPRGAFIGANDGASGVALLMEMGSLMADYEGRYGVDFVLLDGEEFVFSERDPYFHGSVFFAKQYRAGRQEHRYRWGVLLDMVADKDLNIHQERHSVSWPDTRPLVADLWATAARLGVREFIAQPKHQVNDDHLALRNIGGIPTCDVIDFDYGPNHGYWHTEADVPENCSALSLAKVGWVVHEWLKSAP